MHWIREDKISSQSQHFNLACIINSTQLHVMQIEVYSFLLAGTRDQGTQVRRRVDGVFEMSRKKLSCLRPLYHALLQRIYGESSLSPTTLNMLLRTVFCIMFHRVCFWHTTRSDKESKLFLHSSFLPSLFHFSPKRTSRFCLL